MAQLNYEVLRKSGYRGFILEKGVEKVMQFGEGNFLRAYVAFYAYDIQALTDAGLVCRRPKGDEYTVSDDRWVLEFYDAHKDDSPEALVHAVMTNADMWGQDLTEVNGFEAEVVRILKQIRQEGVLAAYQACLE